jgi:hypothetical protein
MLIPVLIALVILAFHLLRGDARGFFEAIAGLIFGFVVVTILHLIF